MIRSRRRIVATLISVAAVGMAIAAATATAGPAKDAHHGAAGSTCRCGRRCLPQRVEPLVRLHSRLRSDRRVSRIAIGIYSNLLVRTLVGYNHVAGAAGNVVVPDLATNLGTVSKDGLTYTFHLKSGIKFGPPLNREITSKDVLFAFERLGTKALIPDTPSTTR